MSAEALEMRAAGFDSSPDAAARMDVEKTVCGLVGRRKPGLNACYAIAYLAIYEPRPGARLAGAFYRVAPF